MSIKKARKTLQNKEKFNYDILDEVANSGGIEIPFPVGKMPPDCKETARKTAAGYC